jgi:hypothetical protein
MIPCDAFKTMWSTSQTSGGADLSTGLTEKGICDETDDR